MAILGHSLTSQQSRNGGPPIVHIKDCPIVPLLLLLPPPGDREKEREEEPYSVQEIYHSLEF